MADSYDIQPLTIETDISFFEIGNDISYLGINYRRPRVMVNSSSFFPFFIVVSDGFTFKVAFQNNIVKAVFVGEPPVLMPGKLFETPEGIFVGMNYRDLLKLYTDIRLSKIEGWAYEAVLISGWKIGFITGLSGTDYFPGPEDKITMIYKN
jgi:hypothetical protein